MLKFREFCTFVATSLEGITNQVKVQMPARTTSEYRLTGALREMRDLDTKYENVETEYGITLKQSAVYLATNDILWRAKNEYFARRGDIFLNRPKNLEELYNPYDVEIISLIPHCTYIITLKNSEMYAYTSQAWLDKHSPDLCDMLIAMINSEMENGECPFDGDDIIAVRIVNGDLNTLTKI